MKSIKARKQRKAYFNAPLHIKQKNISSHLEENLLLKYDRRSVPLISGDTVKITRGAFKGHEDKVADIHVKKYRVEVEGVTITKADGKKIAKPLHPSNLIITKLNLTDKWRRKNLESKVSAETKKEIEAEAKQQLKEAELERKRIEEERLAAEAEVVKAEEEEEPEEAEKAPEKDEDITKDKEKKPPVKKEKMTSSPAKKNVEGKKATSNDRPSKKEKKTNASPSKKVDTTPKETKQVKKVDEKNKKEETS